MKRRAPGRAESDEVAIHEYDPGWPTAYAEEEQKILLAAGARIIGIEHFGSTAVPGLAAKPVIDIVVTVSSVEELDALTDPLERLGYRIWSYPARRLHVKWVNGVRTHHVHVVADGSEFWSERLLFRDYLRAHPGAAKEYEAVKRQLAGRYRTDREAYTEAKAAVVQSIGRAAKAWDRAQSR